MEDFLTHLKGKNFQKRTVAIIENGSWAPMAGKKIREALDSMKEITLCEPLISIKSDLTPENREAMDQLADHLLNNQNTLKCEH